MNLLIWQLIDSGFPSGGFAHSGGLEASVQHGHVTSADAVRAFAMQALAQAGRSALPLVTAAHRRPADLAGLDRLSDAFLSSSVANRASRAQGRALLASVARSFPHVSMGALEAQVHEHHLAMHHAPMFGAIYRTLEIPMFETQQAFLFTSLRSVASAAVRLGLIGGYEAQELQASLSGRIDDVIRRCGDSGPRDIAQTAPLVDLFQSTHDRLYSRLFQS
jgi:urease accessory protein